VLPPFGNYGYLPPGIHRSGVDEFIARFGNGSAEREVEIQELLDFFAWARQAGIERIVVNGSFVTAKIAPNDVDIVILPGRDYPRQELPFSGQEARWPFLQVVVAVDESDLEEWCYDGNVDSNRLHTN
jgi:hypothetical protein